MRMLFTTTPAVGHFLPMLPLMRAARAAGHQVVVATGPDLAPEVTRRGYQVWAMGPTLAESHADVQRRNPTPPSDFLEQVTRAAKTLFARPSAIRARVLVPRAQRWRPHVVVHDLTEAAGAEVAAATGAYQVVHGWGTHLPGLEHFAPIMTGEVARLLRHPDRLSNILGSTYIDPCPPTLQLPNARPFADVQLLRPEAGEVYPDEEPPAEMANLDDRPLVYLTMGTVFNNAEVLAAALQALRQLPINVVATTGRDLDPASLGPQPANVVVRPYVPQALVLPRATVLISHAGSGTMIGGLAEGVPQVSVPQGADQFGNAAQLERVGAGITIPPPELGPERIRDAVATVLDDPSYGRSARRLQAEIRRMPDAAEALDRLEQEAGARKTA